MSLVPFELRDNRHSTTVGIVGSGCLGGTLECARNGACKLLCPLSGNRGQVNVCLRIGSVMQRPTSAATRRPTSAAPPRPSSANPARRSPRAEAFVQLQQRTGHLADTEPVWVADAVGMQQDIAAKTETLNVLQRSAAFKEAQLRSLAEDLATTMHDQPLVEAPDLPMQTVPSLRWWAMGPSTCRESMQNKS